MVGNRGSKGKVVPINTPYSRYPKPTNEHVNIADTANKIVIELNITAVTLDHFDGETVSLTVQLCSIMNK